MHLAFLYLSRFWCYDLNEGAVNLTSILLLFFVFFIFDCGLCNVKGRGMNLSYADLANVALSI